MKIQTDKDLSPAGKKAYDYLCREIRSGVWGKGERIPAAVQLARATGVTRPALLRATLLLKSQGVLCGVPHGPLRMPGADSPRESPDAAAWQLKRSELEDDLLTGSLSADAALPSIKELTSRYGTCFATMRKILRSMVSDSILTMQAKKYQVCQPSLRTGEKVWFITPSINFPPRSALNPAEYRVLNMLERECSRRKLRLQIVEFDYAGNTALPAELGRPTGSTLGHVVDVWWFDQPRIHNTYTGLIGLLAKSKKPVALIDEAGNFSMPPGFCASPGIQAFKTSDRGAGMMMAQLLRQQGHESAAFISISAGEMWSQQRFAGAAQIFTGKGSNPRLVQYGSASTTPWFWLLFHISGFEKTLIKKIMAIDRSTSQADEEFKAYSDFRDTRDMSLFMPDDITHIRYDAAVLRDLMHRNPGPYVFPIAFKAITDGLNGHFNRVFHRPLFKKALTQGTATAWICANDISAIGALDFLRENRIAVPNEISVSGFDNIPDQGLKRHLTSFDFNAQGLIYRIMEYLARPPRPRPDWHHTPIEIEGMIMERESTGRIKQA